jgi:serine protease Do
LAKAEVAQKELDGLPPGTSRYAFVAKIIEPSVVGVQTTIHVDSPFGEAGLFEPDVRAMAQGSGVIVDSAGYILTNAHVISQAAENGVAVQLGDGRTIERAVVVGIDAATDLAVLKIDAGELVAAKWGDTAALQVGDPVLAVGSPYGLAETVTAGIISAKNRRVGIERVRYEDFLQTDAAVNPGNSGGPLVNMNGEVVGINTAIVGHVYQGIGFAIPSDLAKKVYGLLKSSGIPRGWAGVGTHDLTKTLADEVGVKDTQGALLARVIDDSPAEKAGLKPGDVVVKWESETIANSNDLRIAIAKTQPGAKARIEFYRGEERRSLTITVAERPNTRTQ